MKYVPAKITHGYYNVMGFLRADYADRLVANWSTVGAKAVVPEEAPELDINTLAELRVVSGHGRYISIWVAAANALACARRLVVAFDREVIYHLEGREVARFDMVEGRAVLKPHKSLAAIAA